MIGPQSHPQRREQILTQQASDTLVLLNLDNGEYYTLNDVGIRVWDLCDGKHSVSEMVAILCQEYEAPHETIAADVLELLQDLAYERMVDEGP
jgi:hypothetical protein